jgi:hypothetical protein
VSQHQSSGKHSQADARVCECLALEEFDLCCVILIGCSSENDFLSFVSMRIICMRSQESNETSPKTAR